jgi:hypothetical protein
MTNPGIRVDDFRAFYVRTLQAKGVAYHTDEFLYPHDPPWPQMSFDYPYGQAPEVDDVPAPEMEDWLTHVASYYQKIALGIDTNIDSNGPVAWVEKNFEDNGLPCYADLDDDKFLGMLCEGLYSKLLSGLDPSDVALFGVPANDGYQYLKADFSCLRVVRKTWAGEHITPTIAVVRRRTDAPGRYHADGAYQLYKVAYAVKDPPPDGPYRFGPKQVLVPDTSEEWRLAKYFVLQGAAHRINLIDHVKVHFPNDTINVMTKSVLPEWHLLHQVLMPHFWLTLPVNNAVLEGDRSLINRDTWYPWSPFAAKGAEIRKLLPFSWGGNEYYYPDEANQAFPRFVFSTDPAHVPDPNAPGGSAPTFIGLDASLYGAFQHAYFTPVLRFAHAVVAQLPDPPTDPEKTDDLVWLEIQHWAYEISQFLPGFPDWRAICDPDTLARVIAVVIWNASVVHSCDHATLHAMMHDDSKPVPFVLRVFPPWEPGHAEARLKDVLGGAGRRLLHDVLLALWDKIPIAKEFPGIEKSLEDALEDLPLPPELTPLAWPTDVLYAQMTDLLFYLPHNASLLWDCRYAFESTDPPKPDWKGRPLLDEKQKLALRAAHEQFQSDLLAVDAHYFPPGNPNPVATALGLPRLDAPRDWPEEKQKEYRVQRCIGAGIQY